MTQATRQRLGDYMSTECFRFLRLGAEDTAGRAMIIAAGRQRGMSLADVLKGIPNEGPALTEVLNKVLGMEGTRLCIVDKISKNENGYQVEISESACSSGLHMEEPNCAFTMGVFVGALELVGGRRLMARETECVAVKGEKCIYELEYI